MTGNVRLKGESPFAGAALSVLDTAAHLLARQMDVLHDADIPPAAKRVGLSTIAALARDFAVTWALRFPQYGATSEAIWFRACGLTETGDVPAYVLDRIEPHGSPDGPEGGESDAG